MVPAVIRTRSLSSVAVVATSFDLSVVLRLGTGLDCFRDPGVIWRHPMLATEPSEGGELSFGELVSDIVDFA